MVVDLDAHNLSVLWPFYLKSLVLPKYMILPRVLAAEILKFEQKSKKAAKMADKIIIFVFSKFEMLALYSL